MMTTEARLYHLTRQTIEQALPELLEKTLARGWRAVVRFEDEKQVEAMNSHLWRFRDDSFLPHGAAKDGCPERQPVWLTTKGERPNDAQALFLINGAEKDAKAEEPFALVSEVFEGAEKTLVETIAARRQPAHKTGAPVYWLQTAQGWVQKSDWMKAD